MGDRGRSVRQQHRPDLDSHYRYIHIGMSQKELNPGCNRRSLMIRRISMFTPRRFCASSFLLFCLLSIGRAQGEQPGSVGQKASQTNTTVTAAASAERVRFTAPSNVVRMQLHVISESGQILFDVSS